MKKHSDDRHPDLELALQRIEPFRTERVAYRMPSGRPSGVIGDLSDVIARLKQDSAHQPIFCTYDPTDCSEAA